MPHPTHAPPIPARTSAPVELSLEARLAATDAAMTVRLEEAGVAYEVNTAHIDIESVDLVDVLAFPLTPTLQPPTPYAMPMAALLQRAHQRMLTGDPLKLMRLFGITEQTAMLYVGTAYPERTAKLPR
ncbi:hypothetical protein [Streptomyces sp. NPDC055005]